MKRIQLNTAATDNGGHRREAGTTVEVGEGERAIDVRRAGAMVERGGACEKPVAAKRKSD